MAQAKNNMKLGPTNSIKGGDGAQGGMAAAAAAAAAAAGSELKLTNTSFPCQDQMKLTKL